MWEVMHANLKLARKWHKMTQLLRVTIIIKSCQINFLHMFHIKCVFQKPKMAEHVLIWCLNGKCSLISDFFYCTSNVHPPQILEFSYGYVQSGKGSGSTNS